MSRDRAERLQRIDEWVDSLDIDQSHDFIRELYHQLDGAEWNADTFQAITDLFTTLRAPDFDPPDGDDS